MTAEQFDIIRAIIKSAYPSFNIMKKIVKELMNEGKTIEEIGKQLGMKPEEIFRLSDFSKEDFLNMMTKDVGGFSKAEFVTKI